jgi:hypothetical protein
MLLCSRYDQCNATTMWGIIVCRATTCGLITSHCLMLGGQHHHAVLHVWCMGLRASTASHNTICRDGTTHSSMAATGAGQTGWLAVAGRPLPYSNQGWCTAAAAVLTLVSNRGWTSTVRWLLRMAMLLRDASSSTSFASCGSSMPRLLPHACAPYDALRTSTHRWKVAGLPQEGAAILLPAAPCVVVPAAVAATSSCAAAVAAKQNRRPMASTAPAADAHQALRRALAG